MLMLLIVCQRKVVGSYLADENTLIIHAYRKSTSKIMVKELCKNVRNYSFGLCICSLFAFLKSTLLSDPSGRCSWW